MNTFGHLPVTHNPYKTQFVLDMNCVRYTVQNLEKCILKFGEMHFKIWRNTLYNYEDFTIIQL